MRFIFEMMNHQRAYEIAFVGLKLGVHIFNYEINDAFFTDYGEQDFSNCRARIKVTLEKNTSLMLLKFEVAGNIDVVCDRCTNILSKELWDEFNMVVKMVENPDEMNEQEDDPDIFYIGYNESHLHLADWIYEFVLLSIPIQKNCGDEQGGAQCNLEVLKKLKQMESESNSNANNIWKDLDKLNDLKENDLN